MKENSWIGWIVNDVVTFEKEWCPICAKARVQEIYNGWKYCMGCGMQTEPTVPFSVDRYVKGENN